jgi:hypothetical protein
MWYSKWFTNTFIKFSNWAGEDDVKKHGTRGMGLKIFLAFVRNFIALYAVALFFTTLNVHTIAQTLGWGLLITFGFVATIAYNGVLWEGQHIESYYFNAFSKISGILVPMLVYTVVSGFKNDTLALF